MTLDIRFNEIIEEIKEDLELQAGLVLSSAKVRSLIIHRRIVFKKSEIKPYLNDITEYLSLTSPSERVWNCYKVLSNNTYIIAIHLESPYIYFSTDDLNG